MACLRLAALWLLLASSAAQEDVMTAGENVESLGLEFSKNALGQMLISKVTENSWAAGVDVDVEAGDEVVRMNDQPVTTLSSDQFTDLSRKRPLTLLLSRKRPLTLALPRKADQKLTFSERVEAADEAFWKKLFDQMKPIDNLDMVRMFCDKTRAEGNVNALEEANRARKVLLPQLPDLNKEEVIDSIDPEKSDRENQRLRVLGQENDAIVDTEEKQLLRARKRKDNLDYTEELTSDEWAACKGVHHVPVKDDMVAATVAEDTEELTSAGTDAGDEDATDTDEDTEEPGHHDATVAATDARVAAPVAEDTEDLASADTDAGDEDATDTDEDNEELTATDARVAATGSKVTEELTSADAAAGNEDATGTATDAKDTKKLTSAGASRHQDARVAQTDAKVTEELTSAGHEDATGAATDGAAGHVELDSTKNEAKLENTSGQRLKDAGLQPGGRAPAVGSWEPELPPRSAGDRGSVAAQLLLAAAVLGLARL